MFPSQKPFRGIQLNKAHPLARGLVGCWVFNEMTGNTVFDMSGNGNDGTIVGADWVPDGLDFDGTDKYVDIKTKQFENIFHKGATGQFSIVFRYAPSKVSSPGATKNYTLLGSEQAAGDRVQFAHENNWGTNIFKLMVYDGWALTTVNTITITSLLTEGKYSTIVLNWDGSNAYISIDGVDVSNTTALVAANFPDGSQNYFRIGDQQNTSNYLYGGVESAYLFDLNLSHIYVAWLNREPYLFFEPVVSPASLYYETPSGLSIPVAMNHYKQMMG